MTLGEPTELSVGMVLEDDLEPVSSAAAVEASSWGRIKALYSDVLR